MNDEEEAKEVERSEKQIELEERQVRLKSAKKKLLFIGGSMMDGVRSNARSKKGKKLADENLPKRTQSARRPSLAPSRTLRGTTVSKTIVAEHALIETERKQAVTQTKVQARKSQQKKKYRKEELLLEASKVKLAVDR